MERMTFNAEKRTDSGKGVARKLRAAGQIPAVFYGHQVDEALPVTVDPDTLEDLLTTKRGRNIVFKLAVGEETFDHVMVKDYQLDPIRRNLLHADFVRIDPDERVVVRVPVETTGRPVGVREGGRLQMVRAELDVSVRPDDIPEVFIYDVTKMAMGDSVLASEIPLPAGIEPAWKTDYAVARIAIPRGTTAAVLAAARLGADVDVPGEEPALGEAADATE